MARASALHVRPAAVPEITANPERADATWPPAVIAGAYLTGVRAVRTLKRRGVRTVCIDCNPATEGFRSVYGPAILCPDPDQEPAGWLEFMVGLSGRLGARAALIPSSDRYVSAIARHADVLRELYLLSAGVPLQGLLAEKQSQYDLASRNGMPMPHTRSTTSAEEVIEFARNASFPCLLKPTHFREWERFPKEHPLSCTKVAIAESPRALLDLYHLASVITPNVILQEVIEGPDTNKRVYLSCYDKDGDRIANAMFRELRCDPLGFGPATVTEPIVDAEVDEVCDRFLRRIGYVGVCEIEMKRDARDGRVKLIEANPRLSGGGDAAPYAGVDLCWLHYLDLIGVPVAPVAPTGKMFKHIVVRAEARAVVSYRRAGLISWRDILASYRPPLAFFDLDPRDWRCTAETLYVAARLMFGEVSRALFSRGRSSHDPRPPSDTRGT